MESITAEPRQAAGKAVRILRKKGMLPAVIYGKDKPTESISVPQVEFLKLWRSAGESSLISLVLEGAKKNVLIHDVARDPIKSAPIHVDFYLVDMAKKVEVEVPLEFIGEEEAAKASGGLIVKVMHNIKVEALPNDLPHSITVDISGLKATSDSMAIKDLPVPKGVAILNDPHETIVLIEALRAEEVPEVAAPAISDIEVLSEKKKAEGEEAGEAPTEAKPAA